MLCYWNHSEWKYRHNILIRSVIEILLSENILLFVWNRHFQIYPPKYLGVQLCHFRGFIPLFYSVPFRNVCIVTSWWRRRVRAVLVHSAQLGDVRPPSIPPVLMLQASRLKRVTGPSQSTSPASATTPPGTLWVTTTTTPSLSYLHPTTYV